MFCEEDITPCLGHFDDVIWDTFIMDQPEGYFLAAYLEFWEGTTEMSGEKHIWILNAGNISETHDQRQRDAFQRAAQGLMSTQGRWLETSHRMGQNLTRQMSDYISVAPETQTESKGEPIPSRKPSSQVAGNKPAKEDAPWLLNEHLN